MPASLTLHPLFSDHAVLPRDAPVPVFGRGVPGQTVKVSLAGKSVTVRVDAGGSWRTELGPFPAGGPHVLSAALASKQLIRRGVLFGDVWLLAGDSGLSRSVRGDAASAMLPNRAGESRTRLFETGRRCSLQPQETCEGRWIEPTQATAANVSAVAHQFARTLETTLDCPVGIILATWNDMAPEGWVPPATIRGKPELSALAAPLDKVLRLVSADEAAGVAVGTREMREDRFPGSAFNGMLAPLVRFPVRGAVLWSGVSRPASMALPRSLFGNLVSGWREAWQDENLPFLLVQAAGADEGTVDPQGLPLLRESQLLSLRLPGTGLVVSADLSTDPGQAEALGRTVSERLVLSALAVAYGRSLPRSGPVYGGQEVVEDRVIIDFDHAAGGLRDRGTGGISGFEIAGVDRKFAPAGVRIVGDAMVVSASSVNRPVAVRYAWRPRPLLTLENGAGLPASPFRTDDWEV